MLTKGRNFATFIGNDLAWLGMRAELTYCYHFFGQTGGVKESESEVTGGIKNSEAGVRVPEAAVWGRIPREGFGKVRTECNPPQ